MSIPPEKVRDVSDETTAQPDLSTSSHLLKCFYIVTSSGCVS